MSLAGCAGMTENQCRVASPQYLEGWWMGNATYRQRTAGTEGT